MENIKVGEDSFVDLGGERVGTVKVKSVKKWKGGKPDGECFLRVYYKIKKANESRTEGKRLALVSDNKVIAIAICGSENLRRILSDPTWRHHSSVVQESDPDGFTGGDQNIPDGKYDLHLVQSANSKES
ncbi:hypothetical protein KAR26_01710 [Candidatus Parcubacteria bacterium]|nr:hypothetical protein [Candidatus Parcubacteria bacterium]